VTDDWKHRAEREAAAIIAQALPNVAIQDYGRMVDLVAIGWLQGVSYGTHATMEDAERAFDRLKHDLETIGGTL
jgi:hypothetical protein